MINAIYMPLGEIVGQVDEILLFGSTNDLSFVMNL